MGSIRGRTKFWVPWLQTFHCWWCIGLKEARIKSNCKKCSLRGSCKFKLFPPTLLVWVTRVVTWFWSPSTWQLWVSQLVFWEITSLALHNSKQNKTFPFVIYFFKLNKPNMCFINYYLSSGGFRQIHVVGCRGFLWKTWSCLSGNLPSNPAVD